MRQIIGILDSNYQEQHIKIERQLKGKFMALCIAQKWKKRSKRIGSVN
jgi:hypothetical protein